MKILLNSLLALGICLALALEVIADTIIYGLVLFLHYPIKSAIIIAVIFYLS